VTGSVGAPSSFSAHWVGVDGYSDGTVEQLGTEADVDSAGHTQYYAWFEMYPHPGYYITLPNDGYVLPGNQMMAEISYGAGSRFQLRLSNLSQRWYFQTSQWQLAQRSSAESWRRRRRGREACCHWPTSTPPAPLALPTAEPP
jgi:hypothetical protein